MKKLLSLLSVLTISGTAAPNIIAASPYQKEEQNFDILQRVKRDNKKKKQPPKNPTKSETPEDNNHPSTSGTNNRCNTTSGGKSNRNCKKPNINNSVPTTKSARERILNKIESISEKIFNSDSEKWYKEFLKQKIAYFKETKNIVYEVDKPPSKIKKIYRIKKYNVEDSYKKIPLNIEGNKVDLILNKSNLYIDGIITYDDNENKTIVYFKDSDLDKNAKSLKTEQEKLKLFSQVLKFDIKDEKDEKIMIKKLDFDSNYQTLTSGDTNIKINKENIKRAIINLSKINENKISKIKSNKKAEAEIKKDFLRVIFMTAEATRFFSVREELIKVFSSSESEPYEITWQDHKETLTNWDKNSQKYYKIKDGTEFSNEEQEKIYNVAVLAVKDEEKIRKNNDNLRGG